jgi:hypothetical protein
VHSDERGETCALFLARAAAFYAESGVKVQVVMTDNAMNYRRSGLLPRPWLLCRSPTSPSRRTPEGKREGRAVQPDDG